MSFIKIILKISVAAAGVSSMIIIPAVMVTA
jgi:hypothetical protein